MKKSEIISRITPIFQDILENNEMIITDDLSSDDIEDWDSLSNIRIIVSIEQELNIKFDISEISNTKNVGEIIELIDNLL